MHNNKIKKLASILSLRAAVPIECIHCTESTSHALQSLLQQANLVCQSCEHTTIFSNTELKMMQLFFKKEQYHYSQA